MPAEVLRTIREVEIKARILADEGFLGGYRSVFRGSGLEFEEVREYQPGDDVRSIDWNVAARMGVPYIKRYREERELVVLLAVDVSASSWFGTAALSKRGSPSRRTRLGASGEKTTSAFAEKSATFFRGRFLDAS